MLEAYLIIFKNIFLSFTIVPFTSGTYYKSASLFLGNITPFIIKVFAITLALTLNYLIGRILRHIARKKQFAETSDKVLFSLILSFIPVISGFLTFYCGLAKIKLGKVLPIIFFVNSIYYAVAIYWPFLNIYF